MKNRKSLSILSIIMTVIILYIIIENIKHNDPMAEILERRTDIVENIDFLGFEENGSETRYFTLGEVIDSSNLFLSVDWVKKTWLGYRWIDGGGHTSMDITTDASMTVQYVGEFIDMDEMLFGMISKKGISKVFFQLNDARIESLTHMSQKNHYLYYYMPLEMDQMMEIDGIILVDDQGNEMLYNLDTDTLVNQEGDFKIITIDLTKSP